MSDLSFCQTHKILVYQDIAWTIELSERRSILVRSEIIDENKITQCPTITIEKYNKCYVLGYGQCRRDPPIASSILKRTILSDVFWLKSTSYPGRIWVHKRFLMNEAENMIQKLLSTTNVYIVYPGMESTITKPLFKRNNQIFKSVEQLNTQNQTNSPFKPIVNQVKITENNLIIEPICSLKEVSNSIKTMLPSLPNPFFTKLKEIKEEKKDEIPHSFNSTQITMNINCKKQEKIQILSVKIIKSIFTIGSEFLGPTLICVKVIAEGLFGTLNNFPLKIQSPEEMKGYTNDFLKIITNSFIKPESYLISGIFVFGIEYAQLKKIWDLRMKNKEAVNQLITDMKKYFQIISFCFTDSFREYIENVFKNSLIPSEFDIFHFFKSDIELFKWNIEQTEYLSKRFTYK
ncbi:hypothetical protein EHI8A_012490 [Entamoeba histolytica HM-1:IMSS-B]|uniref:Uncharacterized protein n=6 Tax=Entamoeba histolytica TaxID=5759 RepID=C4LX89_ENTH1|nr:hypothetical protein EHI_013230 [Entamoeba histolytica HM-1:IMSS]EMD47149.1 Hypothetical protein EHI5A_007980 [Entamoeba histolytica KU27]EMH78098.1 hypothetical protein EHI8A_012490 [Entamoeba histolytica HM-1:IMSS-B]ENY61497.1 hypothetical protein EHI7A_015420 [Entamoeba histolytica HM-1:IMSS-A]GAT93360.1 hypothetical protein CL6EHI_013230 [Entamoeba histolytica]EAL50952.2 hypothetical protein EHI_013230 [Entamoeba histolytica HM-1:IMSS]|eukprot:XP_656337.2 hypothetical protein EHI_013230 [Entamoeba histolytica HM-1:IMSS]